MAVGVDALNIGVGWHESPVPTVQGAVPTGAFVPWAEALKQSVTVPVIAGNRINRLEDAEAILAAGGVDMVSMSRPFLADPRIIERGKGRAAINVCISCDQACIDRSLVGGQVSCLVNPRSGFEIDFPAPSASPGAGSRAAVTEASAVGAARYVVIGGGPAGLEAARALQRSAARSTCSRRGRSSGGSSAGRGWSPARRTTRRRSPTSSPSSIASASIFI